MKRLLNNKGFTLAEVIVSMLVMMLLVAAVSSIFVPVSQFASSINSDGYIDEAIDNYGSYIKARTVESSSLIVTNVLTDLDNKTDYSLIYIDDEYDLCDYGKIVDPNCGTINNKINNDATFAHKEFRVFNDEYYESKIKPYKWNNPTTTGLISGFNKSKTNIFKLVLTPEGKLFTRIFTFKLPNVSEDDQIVINLTHDVTDPDSGEYDYPIYILYK